MKRKIAIFLTIVLMLTALLPATAFAADDKGMESVLKIVKSRITIPSDYSEFTYSVNSYNGTTRWEFSWSKKGSTDKGPYSVTADSNGNILSYNHYINNNYNERKLPKISKDTARATAEAFIKKIYPDIYSKLKYIPNSQIVISSDYSLSFTRVQDGVLVPDNNVNININSNTGEVTNCYCNWTDGLVFPAAKDIKSLKEAQEIYKDKIGLRLVYDWNGDAENPKIFAKYTPKFTFPTYIDAVTGELTTLNQYVYYGGMSGAYDEKMKMSKEYNRDVGALTPEEIRSVEEVSKLKSQSEAEKIARDFSELGLTSEFSLTNSNLIKDWSIGRNYVWNMNFDKQATDASKGGVSVSVSINASTGEIINFNRYYYHNENEKSAYDKTAAKNIVDNFVKSFKSEKYNDLIYDDTADKNDYLIKMGKQETDSYSFIYYRKVNGIPFLGNKIQVTFDAIKGKITYFTMNWSDTKFPSIDKVLPVEKVYDKLFSNIGLELEYRFDYSDNSQDSAKVVKRPDTASTPKIKLVYALKQDKPASFDANTGNIINYDGEPYKEIADIAYTDIKGNFAEQQIKTLASCGIYLEGTQFKPNDKITQLDFLTLLAKTLDYYGTFTNDSKAIDDLYYFLINRGIVKESEKAPSSNITRIAAAKFFVRAMGYEKVAEIKGIYKTVFRDADKLGNNLGYAAIVQGFNIMNGIGSGIISFLPDQKMSRAEAAVAIYNYLQR